jgi:hypothetical protein
MLLPAVSLNLSSMMNCLCSMLLLVFLTAISMSAQRFALNGAAFGPSPPPQGYIYVEAHKEASVREALKGLRMIFASKPPKLVPLKEMVDAIRVTKGQEKAIGEHRCRPHWSVRVDLCLHSSQEVFWLDHLQVACPVGF